MSAHIDWPQLSDLGLPVEPGAGAVVIREMEASAETAQRIIRGEEKGLRFRLRMPDGRVL